jgi:hypothetical protein
MDLLCSSDLSDCANTSNYLIPRGHFRTDVDQTYCADCAPIVLRLF